MSAKRSLAAASVVVCSVVLAACQGLGQAELEESTPVEPPAVSVPSDAPVSTDFADPCAEWAVEELSWRSLGDKQESVVEDSGGDEVQVTRGPLPPANAERYNVGVEVCPGILLVVTNEGESRYVSLADWTYAEGPSFSTSGETSPIPDRGVASGGPTWGFRDGLIAEGVLFLSDAVIDTVQQCVRVDVHRVSVASVLEGTPQSEVILQSTPCVSYTDPRRQSSAIRTHMGAALAIDEETNNLYVSLGDFHLGASTIAQAAGIGLEGTILDYEILSNPSSMVGSVVQISDPFTSPSASVYAKGLRNSLGMAFDTQGTLWLSDHGPQGGDELNAITQGANYGWPLTSTGRPYDRGAWPRSSNALIAPWLDFQDAKIEGTTDPLLTWTPAIAPTEMVLYPEDGPIAHYRGNMLMASLRAESLFALDVNGAPTAVSDLRLGERQRDMTVTVEGDVLLLADSNELVAVQLFRR